MESSSVGHGCELGMTGAELGQRQSKRGCQKLSPCIRSRASGTGDTGAVVQAVCDKQAGYSRRGWKELPDGQRSEQFEGRAAMYRVL